VGIEFDPKKNERNLRERGLSFERAADFDFETAIIFPEVRQGEASCDRVPGQAAPRALLFAA
jgi:uncharacterized DUF497 family protein